MSLLQLPVHIILGAADYQRIRSAEQPILGENPDTDPGAEFTTLGWALYGKIVSMESSEKGLFLNSQSEFEKLCSVDVLGLVENLETDMEFHKNFIEHLHQTNEGFYQTNLPWRSDHPTLPVNRELAVARLRSTTRRLENLGKLDEYHQVMEEQLREGILEPVPPNPTGEVVHYIPHQPVIREDSELTKLGIVYDCSAKADPQLPSLNDCLEKGPSLQPLLFDILLRNRLRRNIMGDLKKAFIQVQINEEDRDAQRTLWYNNLEEREIVKFRFTRVIFWGCAKSLYLGGNTATTCQIVSRRISTYSESLTRGQATTIMEKGGFTLHKWHSNMEELESKETAKDIQVSTIKASSDSSATRKILGVSWEKKMDVVQVNFESCKYTGSSLTKRKILAAINGVYNLLGWALPVMITGKILFSELCLCKVFWDEQVPRDIARCWKQWTKGLRECTHITVSQSMVNYMSKQLSIHGFTDASQLAVCAAVYVLATYNDGKTSQNLLVSKSRVAPNNVSIPRLQLIAAHTLAKLLSHVNRALSSFDMLEENQLWLDSLTVLYWLANRGTWSKYLRNRVKAIHDLGNFTWLYVPTDQNPSDLGTRGVAPHTLQEFWLKGPAWLTDRSMWPEQPEITESKEASREALPTKKEKVLLEQDGEVRSGRKEWVETILQKHKYWKLLHITAHILRLARNCKQSEKRQGPLTTDEIAAAENWSLKIAQEDEEVNCPYELKKDNVGLWRCHGCIAGYHPAFIPRKHTLAKLIIEHYHKETLHGGVQATMCKVRERFWIPQLRRTTKSAQFKCNRCKKIRAKPQPTPNTSALPAHRTQFSN